ncbi:hypothetical protein TNCV_1293011 [Trichonephila clavipes]|nr:hypothetical protein TNCV_1293011 [Trichonephila clavipes]
MQNREKLSAAGEKYQYLHAWEEETLCNTVERAIYVKLFHPNKGNAPAAVHEFLRKRNLRRGPMSIKGIRAMIKRLEVQHGTGRKRVTRVLVDVVKAAVDT